jgi:phage recombination protein Bet
MNAIALKSTEAEQAVRTALQTSLYPGASNDSVSMVLAYCRAGGLDPMTKPVHIVPMWIKNASGNGGAMRDVVMPGIELYRTKAHRTGEYAGQDEAEFGPTVEGKFGDSGLKVKYPEWCKVTVYRITGAGRVPFTAKVYWLETYATAKRDSDVPNAMWMKRPFGQIEKCAEALALRKAFPEAVGAQPTIEEMEGKTIEGHAVEVKPAAADLMPKAKAAQVIEHQQSAAPAEPVEGEFVEAEQQQEGTGLSELDANKRGVVLGAARRAGLNEEELLKRFPSITLANITATLKSLREIAEKAES